MVKIALFGYSGSGKTTLFRALTGKQEEIYDPFKPNIGIGIYKDNHIDAITEIQKANKVIYPEFELFDFKGFPSSEGFPPHYYTPFFDMDVIVCVVENFQETSTPDKDASSLLMELIFYDTEKVQNILYKHSGTPVGITEQQEVLLKKCLSLLEKEKLLTELTETEKKMLAGFQLLTTRPVILYINGEQQSFNPTAVPYLVQQQHNSAIFYTSVMKVCSLITFYTVKGDIVQGWVIPAYYTARQAAGKIHKDIEKGFIKAAVLPVKDLLEIGSWDKAKHIGALKFLGPNSIISDGDVVEFYFH
ncbi:MAG: DUF933 domain-containing protein [Candidatus Ratteibacteria bacterium]|nr:DUF933 domain-containing protein [Candidatus Ratteibacteria bacterium]